MKKIILIGPTYPYRGGNSLFMSFLYNELKKKHEVDIINFSLMYPEILFPGKTQYDVSEDHFDKVPSLRMLNSVNPFSAFRVARYINKENPDLVVFDWWQPFFGPIYFLVSLFIKKELNHRTLFITENVISHESRWIDKILTKLGLLYARCFLALSKTVQNQIKSMYPAKKVYLSELPVYGWYKNSDNDDTIIRKKLGFNQKDKILLFFGYIRKYKGLDILLKALPAIKTELESVKLIVAGEFYDKPSSYYSLIDELSLTNDVLMINQYIPNEEVSQYFTASDVVVLPYRSATQSGILNMAYGFEKPVIITEVGGLSEFVDNKRTGLVVSHSDPDSIAQGIIEFYKLNEEVDFKLNIRDRVSKNKFDSISLIFEEIMERLS